MNPQPINLLPFCSKDETRPILQQPFNADGYTYATDGAVIVRVSERPEYDVKPDGPKPPNCAIVFLNFPGREDARFLPLTGTGEHPETVVCPTCNGAGWTSELGAEGSMIKAFCPTCDNAKVASNPAPVQVAHRRFKAGYLAKIMRLPGLLVGLDIGHELEPMPFIFDGGEGLLMPMKKEGK